MIEILSVLYVVTLLLLMCFTASTWILLLLWLANRRNTPPIPQTSREEWPYVTVQLPIYNEAAVVGRLLDAVAALDYPRERLRVQVLDDSDDDTGPLIARLLDRYTDLPIRHMRRGERANYKAGALAYGLSHTSDPLVAIFDADFVPPPDFLRRTVPYFLADPGLGLLQARWGHLNPAQNLITRSQALSIDGHFVVEQAARSRSGLLLSFSGAGGVWRVQAICDAGGWSGDTLTEDLDLSYRAQLRGWRGLYLPDVQVQAELPPQVAAYKTQQARWARGTTQNMVRLWLAVWHSPDLNWLQKLMASLHLGQYLPHLFILILVLLTPVLLWAGALDQLSLASLGLVGLGPPLMYAISQVYLYGSRPYNLVAFPLLVLISSGMVFSNSLAVLSGLLGRRGVFRRTPKFSGQPWQQSRYALPLDWTMSVQVALAIYAGAGGMIAVQRSSGIAPYLFLQALGFGLLATWELVENWQICRFLRRSGFWRNAKVERDADQQAGLRL
jgi:cellulose synthase/poly-beta-1,6-N-acetylglucosamine synthase-like glycosyltransferase